MKLLFSPKKHIFWGKFDTKGPKSLSLRGHCLDVALVFRKLTELSGFRRSLESTAKRPLTAIDLDRLSVFVMFHDLGKANLGFQMKVFDPSAPKVGHIRELEAIFDDQTLTEKFASALNIDVIGTWVENEKILDSYLMASWSHHGRPLTFQGNRLGLMFDAEKWWQRLKQWDPFVEIANIFKIAQSIFPQAFETVPNPLPSDPHFHHRFAGLLMLADWLGSHPFWFPIKRDPVQERVLKDKENVTRLLKVTGLDVSGLPQELEKRPKDFQSRFGFSPRPLQALIDEIKPDNEDSRLMIAESETGSGKTEAAIQWFLNLFEAGKVDSLYFALPTRVAAKELYSRIDQLIKKIFPSTEKRPLTLLAVPGYAISDGTPVDRILPEENVINWDDEGLLRRQRFWAAEHPKRFLAATVAVGTIDQALLSCIQTAHAHLRSVCLDRSLLVVDEVHASDIYMGRLLAELLSHHVTKVRGYALLLSATLGSSARTSFLNSVRGDSRIEVPEINEAVELDYPSLTLSSGKTLKTQATTSSSKTVSFEFISLERDFYSLGNHVVKALEEGARVMVVLNTVNRAISLLKHMEKIKEMDPKWFFKANGEICPHHGRFAPADRALLDTNVTKQMGRESSQGPILLIGTQTLEQSLDIDADLLISDLCPADVLLQRIGRLHRHSGRKRPKSFNRPKCILLAPCDSLEDALDGRGNVKSEFKKAGYGSVYEDLRTLELTLLTIKEKRQISIPQDNRYLVEQVTHEKRLNSLQSEKWDLHAQNITGKNIMKELAASSATACFNRYFGDVEFNEAGERVVTRLGADSLRLPLDKETVGPFGNIIKEMVIPGHMAPKKYDDSIRIEKSEMGRLILSLGENKYSYSRYGLELEE